MRLTRKVIVILGILICLGTVSGCYAANPQTKMYDDVSKISAQGDSYTFLSSVGSDGNKDNRLEIEYQAFSGTETIWQLKADNTGEISINYDSKVKSGKFKLVLIGLEKKVATIFENSKHDSYHTVLQPGEYRIKIVGKKAQGNVQVEIIPGDSMTLNRVDDD